jgi:hypothetical protein
MHSQIVPRNAINKLVLPLPVGPTTRLMRPRRKDNEPSTHRRNDRAAAEGATSDVDHANVAFWMLISSPISGMVLRVFSVKTSRSSLYEQASAIARLREIALIPLSTRR